MRLIAHLKYKGIKGESIVMKKSILQYLREIVCDMVDDNDNVRTIPVGAIGKLKLSNNKIKFLSDLIVLLRDTSIINQETKLYIKNRYISMRRVIDLLEDQNMSNKKRIKESTVAGKVQYDRDKLTKIFGESMFTDVLSKTGDISIYERILLEQYLKYNGNTDELRKNLLLNIPKNCVLSELDEKSFEEFISIIAPYTKNQVKYIEDNIDTNSCGYFNYLLSMPNLSRIDKERLRILQTLLGDDKQ